MKGTSSERVVVKGTPVNPFLGSKLAAASYTLLLIITGVVSIWLPGGEPLPVLTLLFLTLVLHVLVSWRKCVEFHEDGTGITAEVYYEYLGNKVLRREFLLRERRVVITVLKLLSYRYTLYLPCQGGSQSLRISPETLRRFLDENSRGMNLEVEKRRLVRRTRKSSS